MFLTTIPPRLALPVISPPVLTNEEAARLVIAALNNNGLTVPLGGRIYWGIPGTGAIVPLPQPPQQATAKSSSSISIPMIAGIVAGVLVLVLLVALFIARRNKKRHAMVAAKVKKTWSG